MPLTNHKAFDPTLLLSPHFTLGELCWLPTWRKYHEPSANELANLSRVAILLEAVRTLFENRPIRVHCAIRPAVYNKLIGGAKNSYHIMGLAVDFDIPGLNCDDVRKQLVPHLEALNCRMEKLKNGAGWIHLDMAEVEAGRSRYFKP